ncbi:MAG: hypothetical protein KAR05_03940 [Candidatus Omnitrophica bacterium]|nr:hypothetical protein [Candidatus Omnitrophota bacterium]
MKKYLMYSTLLTITLVVGVIYGFFIHRNHVFPYEVIKSSYVNLIYIVKANSYGPWAIGIYEGSTPFDLADPEDIANPVLTGKDVSDIDALFVADPFMLFKNGKYTIFFEVLNRETNQGDIGYAESIDGKHWEYRKVIIDEKFHLSYPYVFEWEDNYYLIPESNRDLSVRLYKAVSFPEKWEYVGNLLTGHNYMDPSIFRHNEKWWLFASNKNNDVLNLYYSSDLLGEWKSHPMNPIVKFDKNIARQGGRVIFHNDRLYRMAQDDFPHYGMQVFAFEITELTEKSYAEEIVSEKPLVNMTGKGWNAAGMHHVDLHKIGDKWVAVVDGKNR